MALGPWNAPPNFIGAMSAGASAGLQARGQDIAQMEAGDRLTLAYQQLASEERQRTEMAKQRMQAAQWMMQYRQSQLSLLDQYRQQRLAQQGSEAAEKARIAQEAVDVRKQPKLHFGTGGQVLQEMPDGTVKEVRPRDVVPGMATLRQPVDPNNPFGATITTKLTPEEAAAKLKSAPTVTAPMPGQKGFLNRVLDWATGAPATGTTPTPVPGARPTPAASPYKEGQKLRNKKTGKAFYVINGEAVEGPDTQE
jgi:hypothetical protein